MTIKEQIEIARLIASGTPREVAISEKVIPTSSMYRDELTPHEKSKARAAAAKAKQDSLSKSGGETVDTTGYQVVDRKPRTSPGRDPDMGPLRRTTVTDLGPAPTKSELNTKDRQPTYQGIKSDEEGATAIQKGAKNVSKAGLSATKKTAKVAGGALKLGFKGVKRLMRKEEFIQEVEDKKDSKAKKVIDIMKGKNSVKINPDMKEDTVVIQDASGKDSVEIVDIISSQKIRSDWRKEINVTEASAAWQRKEGKSKSGGLNEKGRKSYERQNPGSDLKAPSKKVGNKRRASFCARMKGMKKKLTSAKTARDPNSRINKSLRAWNC